MKPITRVVLEDARGADRSLRVSWHSATATVVFSHWTGDVCTASTPVGLREASEVVKLLVGALTDAATALPEAIPGASRSRRDRLRNWLRPTLAEVIDASSKLIPGRRRDNRRTMGGT